MNKANNEFLICIEANNCDHKTCIHRERHKMVNANDSHQPQCVKGAYCYYKNMPIHCTAVEQKSGGEDMVMIKEDSEGNTVIYPVEEEETDE